MRNAVIIMAGLFALPAMADMLMTQPAPGMVNFRKDQNAPTHLEVDNLLPSGNNIYSEFRVQTKAGGGDFGITGPGFNDGSNLLPGEVFIVAESDASGVHFRSNNENYIRGSIGLHPAEVFRSTKSGFTVKGYATSSFLEMQNTTSGVSTMFLSDASHGYLGTKSSHPFHLMVGYNAKVTMHTGGQMELWRVAVEPAANPTNGGFLYVAPDGALKYKGPNGTVTQLAAP